MNCSLLNHLPITHNNDPFEHIGSLFGPGVAKITIEFQSKKYSLKHKVIFNFLSGFGFRYLGGGKSVL